jgi:alpha-L-fucosidase
MDIGEDSPDLQWWRDAQSSIESRIGWWREARFGCFIHWGAYSALGGEWGGGAVDCVYAEHIQRAAKIPCDVYRREVVGTFNPTEFDAEEWVSAIHRAGMRSLVITAKHHDGFAMFDSDASDFNIVKATPWKQDPMVALKAACKRRGMKFGFYYSHAFDWGEPNGVGNDWDYGNPGGDLGLYGGKCWYDAHPELVPKFRTYVEQKAIPQLQELIRKYDPDMLWFDTPHKLPPEENIRILKAVREAKPGIVINGRILQPYEGMPQAARNVRFGDYRNTGDRAIDFTANDGDWEAIPTTNESYGYRASDRSHKSPEFLLCVLAKAAARGGNLLLNLGPKGDGAIDGVDLEILEGIGQWMDVNEVSIRGTVRTPLPVQPWGESTRRGNTFYLHVFDWPKDGVLELGGFCGTVKNARILSDQEALNLPHQRVDELTIHISVPAQPSGRGHAVIVAEVDDAERVGTHRLISTRQINLLRAFDGNAVGGEFRYGDGKADNNVVDGWKDAGRTMTWPVYVSTPCAFRVFAEYQALKTSEPYSVEIGGTRLTAMTGVRGRSWGFVRPELGTVKLSAGTHLLAIHPDRKPETDLMRLRAVHLCPENIDPDMNPKDMNNAWTARDAHEE